MAAVNITSRDEQYQSYLAQSRHNNSKESANELFRGCDMNGDNTRVSCATPIEEYVDINEMEFIKTQGTGKQGDNNVLMHRSKRKKSTKKGEECKRISHRIRYEFSTKFHFSDDRRQTSSDSSLRKSSVNLFDDQRRRDERQGGLCKTKYSIANTVRTI